MPFMEWFRLRRLKPSIGMMLLGCTSRWRRVRSSSFRTSFVDNGNPVYTVKLFAKDWTRKEIAEIFGSRHPNNLSMAERRQQQTIWAGSQASKKESSRLCKKLLWSRGATACRQQVSGCKAPFSLCNSYVDLHCRPYTCQSQVYVYIHIYTIHIWKGGQEEQWVQRRKRQAIIHELTSLFLCGVSNAIASVNEAGL